MNLVPANVQMMKHIKMCVLRGQDLHDVFDFLSSYHSAPIFFTAEQIVEIRLLFPEYPENNVKWRSNDSHLLAFCMEPWIVVNGDCGYLFHPDAVKKYSVSAPPATKIEAGKLYTNWLKLYREIIYKDNDDDLQKYRHSPVLESWWEEAVN